MCFSLRNWFWLTISWPPFPEASVTLPIWRTLGLERIFSHTFLRKLVRSRCLVWCSVSGQSTYHSQLNSKSHKINLKLLNMYNLMWSMCHRNSVQSLSCWTVVERMHYFLSLLLQKAAEHTPACNGDIPYLQILPQFLSYPWLNFINLFLERERKCIDPTQMPWCRQNPCARCSIC